MTNTLLENDDVLSLKNLHLIPTTASAIPSLTLTSPTTLSAPPVEDWCFDLIVFYRSIADDDAQAFNVLMQLETYSKFSFVVNGIVTCLLACLGLLGNFLFVLQLYKSRYFSRRLASHLAMLCAWDMALLLCCLLTYGIMASYYGILPFVGIVAYLLYFFQPFASFCVTGTIWQVLAITVERYNAVSRPLEQRTRNAQFSLKTICSCIATGAFLLNMVVVPFERRLTDCYEFTQNGYRIRTMIVQQDLVNNQYYAILAHLIPDIIFRAPTPIIAIAILTVRTLQICSRRTVGTQTIQQARRNVPFMLTLLNIKFIMCNTLYMFNTILMEVMGYGGKTSNQQTELEMEQYVKSLYLTDFSNMLLAVHSATNWLIFYHWPRFTTQHRKKKLSSLTLTSYAASKSSSMPTTPSNFVVDSKTVGSLAKCFSEQKYVVATRILTALCLHSQHISNLLLNKDYNLQEHDHYTFSEMDNNVEKSLRRPSTYDDSFRCKRNLQKFIVEDANIQKHVYELGDLIEKVLNSLASRSSIFEWRDMCRNIGYTHYQLSIYCSANDWKLIRNILVESMTLQNKDLINCHRTCEFAALFLKQELHDHEKCLLNCRKVADGESEQQFALTNLQRVMFKAFNFALREMKSGALCAIVDASRCSQQQMMYSQHALKMDDCEFFPTITFDETQSTRKPPNRNGSCRGYVDSKKELCHKALSDFTPQSK